MEKTWYLEDFDLFQDMTKEEIDAVEEHVFMRTLKKGERIQFAKKFNQYVYLVKDGVLKLIATGDDGKQAIVSLIREGNLFGALPLLGDFEIVEDFAEAIEDSTVCFIDTGKLKQWMSANHDLRTRIRAHIGQKLQRIENRLLSMIFKDAKTRVLEFLVDFVKEFGTKGETGIDVKNFLTNDEVAKLTATSRQTVNAIMNDLREKNAIEYNKDQLSIPYTSELLS